MRVRVRKQLKGLMQKSPNAIFDKTELALKTFTYRRSPAFGAKSRPYISILTQLCAQKHILREQKQ